MFSHVWTEVIHVGEDYCTCEHFPGGASGRELAYPCRRHQRGKFQVLDWENPLEEGMATPSSNLAWRIPWTEEPGGYRTVKSWIQLKRLSKIALHSLV